MMLSVAGLSALFAYQNAVRNLRTSQEKDHSHDNLATAISGLSKPLVRIPETNPDANPLAPPSGKLELGFDEALWDEIRETVADTLSEYFRKNESVNSSMSNLPDKLHSYKLEKIRSRLLLLDHARHKIENYSQLAPIERHELLEEIRANVLLLQSLVQDIRNPGGAIDSTLQASDNMIQWLTWLIGIPAVIVVFLFSSLVYFCYQWILNPVRKLHDAASRVANGDYSYRLKLKGKDEMVELAEMFNKMTERFQIDKSKLDREVEERSRQLLRNERLAGVGFLASGIAHEINNPLQAIGNAAESLTSRLSEGSLGRQLPAEDRDLLSTYLGMIERESTRCQQITSRVLDFARGTNGPKSRHDLTKIVAEVLDMVGHMSKFGSRKIVFDRIQPHLVDVSAAEMKQVVLNLVANGLEAMPDAGTLTIQIEELVDEVVLSVQDDGCGMTATVIQNLYEPFFTDKLNGKGTGLGLSITHRIVGDHGGRIEATSDGPGCGSTFRVHLPRCAKAVQSSAA